MRKIIAAFGLVVALAIPVAALAATLDTGKFGDLIEYGENCEAGEAYYYFVQNQIPDGTPAGTLTATFSGNGAQAGTLMVQNNRTQHWEVFGVGTLLSATTSIADGKLVLSHVTCKK